MSKIFDLNVIDPNPYQVRESEDSEHIKKLAMSIARDTMLQVPMGRKYGSHVQLAFGHSRLAAYKYLWDAKEGGDANWAFMPVEIRDLSDQQMFELGVQENIERKNLTPVEEARAMLVYRDKFKKTSEEIGKLFGNLSDSSVRNKMRLLQLPENIQRCLATGEMLEGSARALLRLLDLNDIERSAAEDQEIYPQPSEIIELARVGTGQKRISELIDELMAWLRPAVVKPIPGELLALPLEIPAPEPEPIPSPAPVAMPALQAEPEVEERLDDEDIHQVVQECNESHPEEAAEETQSAQPEVEKQKPAEAVKAIAPAPAAVKPQATTPAPVKPVTPKPAIDLTPAPAPTPAKPLTWRESSITLTLTMWADDGDQRGRMVMIGGRLNSEAPKMSMARLNDLALPQQLVDMLVVLRKSLGDEA